MHYFSVVTYTSTDFIREYFLSYFIKNRHIYFQINLRYKSAQKTDKNIDINYSTSLFILN